MSCNKHLGFSITTIRCGCFNFPRKQKWAREKTMRMVLEQETWKKRLKEHHHCYLYDMTYLGPMQCLCHFGNDTIMLVSYQYDMTYLGPMQCLCHFGNNTIMLVRALSVLSRLSTCFDQCVTPVKHKYISQGGEAQMKSGTNTKS